MLRLVMATDLGSPAPNLAPAIRGTIMARPPRSNQIDFSTLFAAAGIDPAEVRHDPEHGALLSAEGVGKLAAIAPDQQRAQQVRDFVAQTVRRSFRAVAARPSDAPSN